MKRTGILNAELSKAIAAMGHTDIMLVVDAGFPIPREAWRIDLAIAEDLPTMEQILPLIAKELVVEKVVVAEDVPEYNPVLYRLVHDVFPKSDHETIAHQELLSELGKKAKVIVRTGAFNPWGNVALISGVYAPSWFNKPKVRTPEAYLPIVERLQEDQ